MSEKRVSDEQSDGSLKLERRRDEAVAESLISVIITAYLLINIFIPALTGRENPWASEPINSFWSSAKNRTPTNLEPSKIDFRVSRGPIGIHSAPPQVSHQRQLKCKQRTEYCSMSVLMKIKMKASRLFTRLRGDWNFPSRVWYFYWNTFEMKQHCSLFSGDLLPTASHIFSPKMAKASEIESIDYRRHRRLRTWFSPEVFF